MKTFKNFKPVIYLFLFGFGLFAMQACTVYQPLSTEPVTVPDIVSMSKDSVSAKDIINKIRKSHTAYTLKASTFAKLQQEGVADSVLNYMQSTHINLIRHSQQAQDSYYWGPGYYGWYGQYGYGWPYNYGYWGWRSAPIIIYHGDDDHGGGGHQDGDRR